MYLTFTLKIITSPRDFNVSYFKADFLALRMNPFYCKHDNREIVVWNERCANEVTILFICIKIPNNKYVVLRKDRMFNNSFVKLYVLNCINIEQIRIYLFESCYQFDPCTFLCLPSCCNYFLFSVDWTLLCYLQTVTFVIIFYYRSRFNSL